METCGVPLPQGPKLVFAIKIICEVLAEILKYKLSAAMEPLNSTQSNILQSPS